MTGIYDEVTDKIHLCNMTVPEAIVLLSALAGKVERLQADPTAILVIVKEAKELLNAVDGAVDAMCQAKCGKPLEVLLNDVLSQ